MRHSVQFLFLSGLLALPVLFPVPGHGAIVLRVEQAGSDVRVSGEGTVNALGLTLEGPADDWTSALTDVQFYAGPLAFGDGRVDLYSGLLGPSAVGADPGVYELPDGASSTGDLFGIQSDDGFGLIRLVLPQGYRSGDSLAGLAIFPNLSLATLGLAPGQVSTWTWGAGSNADSLRLEVVPAPAPLLGALATFRLARGVRRRLRESQPSSPN